MKILIFVMALMLTMSLGAREKLDDKSKGEILAVLKANEAVHKSFFRYDGKKIEENTGRMAKALKAVGHAEIKKLLTFSGNKLKEIKSAADKEKNNEVYHMFSTALIYVIKKYDVGKGYNAYSCPMVKKNWVQNSKFINKVSNPYSSMMPHCGTKDTDF